MSDGSSPTESTDLGGMTPPEATSQYDFDIQLGSGKRFTCRVGSREARSKWIQAIEVARSSGIPDCPLYDPTDPPDVQDLLAELWPLHLSLKRWRAELHKIHKSRRTNGDGDCRTDRECTRAACMKPSRPSP